MWFLKAEQAKWRGVGRETRKDVYAMHSLAVWAAGWQSLRFMASGQEKVGVLTLSVLRSMCGVFEPKAVQVTKGPVKEDGYPEFLESNMLLFISHLCWEQRIFSALWL